MKRKMIRYLVLAVILFCAGGIAAQKHMAQLYIDPGHGGPNADMTHNGDGAGGCYGPDGTAEQWINLKVALVLRDSLLARGLEEEYDFLMPGGPQLAVGTDRIAPVAL